jgi:hypothetical protein
MGKRRYLVETAGSEKAANVALIKLQHQVDEDQYPKTAITVRQAVPLLRHPGQSPWPRRWQTGVRGQSEKVDSRARRLGPKVIPLVRRCGPGAVTAGVLLPTLQQPSGIGCDIIGQPGG